MSKSKINGTINPQENKDTNVVTKTTQDKDTNKDTNVIAKILEKGPKNPKEQAEDDIWTKLSKGGGSNFVGC